MLEEHFGEHLTLDGYGGSEVHLNDKSIVEDVLKELPNLLGMHVLKDPEVIFAPENDSKDPGGWSGFVIINESHISIHTFPKRGFISADIYSCKNGLDVKTITEYFTNKFQLKDLELNFIIRGKKYPSLNIY